MSKQVTLKKRRGQILGSLALAGCLAVSACAVALPGNKAPLTQLASTPTGEQLVAFDEGLTAGWQDFGWTGSTKQGEPARVDLGGWGGWILSQPGLDQTHAQVELSVRLADDTSPGDTVRVSLGDGSTEFPAVVPAFTKRGQWWHATVPAQHLNPDGFPFDRVMLQGSRQLPSPTIMLVERITLIIVTPPRPVPTAIVPAQVSADCAVAGSHAISPYIYGVAFSPSREGTSDQPWDLGTTARRWGGNPTSRYNWKDGHAWNTASDWYWRNVSILDGDQPAWKQFLATNAAHGTASVVSVPTIGWVAKDRKAYSFPVAEFGPQESTDPNVPDAGNGRSSDGDAIEPPSPDQTSIAASPSFIGQWVREMRAAEGAPVQYVLDNEPDLWADTHRDVHPEPLSYDELAQRTIDYGTAVRQAAPEALIAGPASWGWWGYFYSAVDAEAGFGAQPDRSAHGGQPLLAWYIDQMKAFRLERGIRVLDVLDVHYYPQAEGVYASGGQGGGSLETGRQRVRSTRSLWDRTYEDESWIEDEVYLLPRMQTLIAEHDPSLKLSIGEYSFGGEASPSGAVAQAEALGRFAEFDVYSAFYWTYPKVNSAAGAAFQAYRNFDGKGGTFLDTWVPSTDAQDVSLFTSTDGQEVVAVLINRSDEAQQLTTASFTNCGAFNQAEAFQYDGSSKGLKQIEAGPVTDNSVRLLLPAWSVTTLRLTEKA